MIQIISTVDAYLALFVVLINFSYAILVMVRTSRAAVYVIFFLICIANILWNLGDFLTYFAGSRFWYYLSRIGSSMLPGLMFHFIITLVRSGKRTLTWMRLGYHVSGLFAFTAFLSMFHPRLRWFMDSGLRDVLFLVLLGPLLLIGIAIILMAIRQTNLEDEKERLRYILLASTIGVFTGLTETVQFLGLPIPRLGHVGCLVYSSILAIVIFKHRTSYDILAQMQEKLAFMGEMAAGIAHEIRNPLTSIKGAAGLLAKEMGNIGLQNVKEYHDILQEEIERLNHILLNFQYFTRPLKVEKGSVSVNEIIQKTIRLTETAPVNIRIKQELAGDSPRISADASLLRQVILNLIKNAAEACGQDGELGIKTETLSPWLKISFCDNGPGISPENIKRIFEPFFTTKSTGMGMGLPICQRIIQAHGGRLEVNNRLPKGTEFTILLPI